MAVDMAATLCLARNALHCALHQILHVMKAGWQSTCW